MSEEDAITMFCSVTSSTPDVAEHFLGATDWDVERAVQFFLENPPGDDPVATHERAASVEVAAGPGPSLGAGPDDSDELQRALAESLHTRQGAASGAGGSGALPDRIEVPDSDDEEQGLEFLARTRASGRAAQQQAQEHLEGMLNMANRMMSREGPSFIGDPEFLGVAGAHSPLVVRHRSCFSKRQPCGFDNSLE